MQRTISKVISARAASDGAGVKIKRSLGQSQVARLDPFLMLDQFFSDDANDYIAGFPEHPHRGFQTVTYMLEGHMLHQDSLGNKGDLRSGDVQWMNAARGIIHSEMPQQEEGRMRGFQLWINLPSHEKMLPASYQDVPSSSMPWQTVRQGVQVKMIAGNLQMADTEFSGAIQGLSTEAIMADVDMQQATQLSVELPEGHNAFVYCYQGELTIEGEVAPLDAVSILSEGSTLTVQANQASRFLLLSGKPINEPIAQYGPFVMNTHAELEQAMRDYRDGTLTE
ncbi:quercetin 2,3-dioxygenase [Aliidiomarina taiwanensis]|uniref:Quercetin 2,3-dioxygenase n=1 Tax=Aliidiomarina taiwanensis TaxID=946228 RepID=A0A432X1J0_9GAMM|nr:pirin family protein [Aliidiomarina taiwanensis]RUO40441.1 quercetin 2,3-dioxygenase [Aliidiomarina taiwanensis]